MLTIGEMNDMLNELADEIPPPFFNRLNGGVFLSDETKINDAGPGGNLYILGEYYNDKMMGRYIVLYYGSFCKVCAGYSAETLYERLKKTLLHEFTHHVESLAGERGLEYKDARELAEYRRKMGI